MTDAADSACLPQLLNKDFYHLSATTFEFKDTAPNGVAFKVTGKSSHEKATSAAVSFAPPTQSPPFPSPATPTSNSAWRWRAIAACFACVPPR